MAEVCKKSTLLLHLYCTPSILNYKSFQEFFRVKPSQSLTKIIERNIKIYNIKYVHYENIANKEFNDT